MEKDTKQHSIAYNKGITNQPSYILTDDGELSSCVGLTFENGELKPIQEPNTVSGAPMYDILCVHNGRYIYLQGTRTLCWKNSSNSGEVVTVKGDVKDITTVGNTIIATTTEETHYALWTGSGYYDLETRIPEPEVNFKLAKGSVVSKSLKYSGMCDQDDNWHVIPGQEKTWTDNVYGAFYAAVNELHAQKEFVRPFVLVTAVELYDGSYTLHSSPFIALPWFGGNLYFYKDSGYDGEIGEIFVGGSKVQYCMKTDYIKWKDIVKGVSVFASREISVFNPALDAKFSKVIGGRPYMRCGYALVDYVANNVTHSGQISDIGDGFSFYNIQRDPQYNEFGLLLDGVATSDLETGLRDESVFFKLCDLGIHSTGQNMIDLSPKFSGTTLTNLEAQQQLPNSDFHTHDTVVSEKLYSYNGRLHMSGIKRFLFNGFKTFAQWKTSGTYSYTAAVWINTEQGEQIVVQEIGYTNEAIGQSYFYYPDPRATKARIYCNGYYIELPLTEHPGLNGACYFKMPYYYSDLNGYAYAPSVAFNHQGSAPQPRVVSEYIPNTVMVSEVDNPFLFLPQGYVKVGNTSIVGMAAVTMALSEYQHGHQPLVVFTEDGIWSLSLSAEGYYIAVQAVSREVCNNASSITQVDNGIFFVSAKGLMYLDTAGVKCVSTQMKGHVEDVNGSPETFDDFIDNCMIAYDYRDSLLHIYKRSGCNLHYVYNMKTSTFSIATDDTSVTNIVNAYPDTIIQRSVYATYSFLAKYDEAEDPNVYSGQIETRPMKFGNILTLKSIRHIRHLYSMNSNATVNLTVMASNDGVNWATLTSLRGKPWKLYKFRIVFDHMYATDRYAGTVVWTQERRTEKPR